MKLRFKKAFTYQVDARNTKTIPVGVHEVSAHVAHLARRFGKVEEVVEKVAPENKVAEVPENKAKVERKTKRRRSARAKSDD